MFEFFKKEPLYHYPLDRFSAKSKLMYGKGNLILHIGGGPSRNHPREMNLNLFLMENVDIVARGEQLPFKNNSLDVIISNAVLEHVKDMDRVIKEMERVLKPNGFLYVEIPFVQHYHGCKHADVYYRDYRRLTETGLIDIFEQFCVLLDVGVCVGPTSAVVQVFFTYFEDLCRNKTYKKIVKGLYFFLGNLIVWIDAILPERVIRESRIPSGIYYFGRKREAYSQGRA
jgi:SAM-dependent methyltransferase